MGGFKDCGGKGLKPNYRLVALDLNKGGGKTRIIHAPCVAQASCLTPCARFLLFICLILCLVLEGDFMLEMGAALTIPDGIHTRGRYLKIFFLLRLYRTSHRS